jgi:rhodanese-related sulfurtransferase
MRKAPGIIALFSVMLIILGCSSADSDRPQEKSLAVSEVQRMLRGNNPPRILYTGSLLQWRDEHIPASRCVPCEATEEAITPLLHDRKNPLVLYGNGTITRDACSLVSRLGGAGKPPLFVLSGGLAAWKKNGLATESTERIPRLAVPGISPEDLSGYDVQGKAPLIVDIRSAPAVNAHPIYGALNIPLIHLHERYGEIPLDRPIVVVNEGGGETLLAASFLLRKGVPVTARLQGGITALSAGQTEGGKRR